MGPSNANIFSVVPGGPSMPIQPGSSGNGPGGAAAYVGPPPVYVNMSKHTWWHVKLSHN